MEQWRSSSDKTLTVIKGDITKMPVDAIVNAANSALAGGGGVDGAIHRAGGPTIMRQLDEIRKTQGGCPTGSAVPTTAGDLPAKYVFHAVGPVYRDGKHGEAELLAGCYRTAFDLARDRQVETISFPAISTGVYGYPMHDAALIALTEIKRQLESETSVREAVMVLFDDASYRIHAQTLRKLE